MATRVLTKAQIFAAKDIEEHFIPVPQWGRDDEGEPLGVMIRTFSLRQVEMMKKVATIHNRVTKQDDLDNDKLEMLLFVEGVIDPPMDQDDYEILRDKSAVAMAQIKKAILSASGLSDVAVAEAEKSTDHGPATPILVSPGAGVGGDDGRGDDGADVDHGIHALDGTRAARATRT